MGIANFLWAWFESASLGGDATNGYQRDGRYFVGSHGHFTEVDPATWEWSYIHGTSVWITHPLTLIAAYCLLTSSVAIGRRTGAMPPGPAGPPIAVARCSGRIGKVEFGIPLLLKVRVFADRFTVRPALAAELTILGSEITSLGAPDGRRSGGGRRLVIEHAANGIRSPIALAFAPDHPVRRAIEAVKRGSPADR
ncbi:hypothetical protein [Pseudonocardia acaciae]|uniref:hypothetical protein n=1 Tax=Pseudonocardia acaciae TaxID=551276 RepID=UPI0012ED75AC|nr:hypothetical protein [Pseudonocardia acaciae]